MRQGLPYSFANQAVPVQEVDHFVVLSFEILHELSMSDREWLKYVPEDDCCANGTSTRSLRQNLPIVIIINTISSLRVFSPRRDRELR